eukprot:9109958-Heterocapsa_arctica.AAC.1
MWVLLERPDLSYVVRDLARRVQKPTECDAGRLKRVLRYVKGTMKMEMCLSLDDSYPTEVLGHVDASRASSIDRRSTSGGAIWLQGCFLTHWSKTQPTIAQSTCEAELAALNTGAVEMKLVQTFYFEIGLDVTLR